MHAFIDLGSVRDSAQVQSDGDTPSLYSEAANYQPLIRLLMLSQMHEEGRYHEMLFISDTCQAASLYGSIQAPHIVSMASSKIGNIPYHY